MAIKLPIQIAEDDISIEGQIVCINYQGKKYKGYCSGIPFYRYEVNEVKDPANKLKMLHFLLTNDVGMKNFTPANGRYFFQFSPYMRITNIEHDPNPNHSLTIFPFQSLQSIQAHLIEHGIADYWLHSDEQQPHVLSGIIKDEEEIKTIWKNFLQVGCPRWSSFNLPAIRNQNERKQKWENTKENIQNSNFTGTSHICFNCINDYGADVFIRCCNCLKDYRIKFLERLKNWIVETIKDEKMKSLYADKEKIPQGDPARRHIHILKQKSILYAYVIEDSGLEANLFIVIFDGNDESYVIRTCYGIGKRYSVEEAKQLISEKVGNLRENQISHYCYRTNWDAII